MAGMARLSPEFQTLAEEAVKAEMATGPPETLKQYYIRCFEQARDDGVPKHEISKVVRARLNQIKTRRVRRADPDAPHSKCIINPGWYDKCARACGYTDPAMARHVKKDADVQGHHPDNSGGNGEGNAEIVKRLGTMREICTLLMARLRSLDEGVLEGWPDATRTDFYTQWDARLRTALDMLDAKTKVPASTQLLLLTALDEETNLQRAVMAYYEARLHAFREMAGSRGAAKVRKLLTRKQAGSIQAGEVRQVMQLLAPHDRDDAVFKGYVGQQCEGCGSWRTRPDPDSLHSLACVDCGARTAITSVKQCPECMSLLYQEDLREVRRTGNCPHEGCGVPIVLPASADAPPSGENDVQPPPPSGGGGP